MNIARRHLSAGARAVIAAQAARMDGRGAQAEAAKVANLQVSRLSDANQVLDWAPDLVPNVVAGVHPLYKAVETARQRNDSPRQNVITPARTITAERPAPLQRDRIRQASGDTARHLPRTDRGQR